MDKLLLHRTLVELTERLDMYFHGKLRREPRARADLEYNKEELFQNLVMHVWAEYSREAYKSYPPDKFIWLKAKNVWIEFARNLGRQSKHTSNALIEDLPENYVAIDFLDELENRNTVNMIESILTPEEVELLHYRAHGFTYKQIKDSTNYFSANAAKTTFNRIKKRIQIRFRRP